MSTPAVLNAPWPAQNAVRAYPFASWCPRTDESGAFRIPDDLIVAASFPTGPEVAIDPTRFHLLSLSIYANGVGLRLGYAGPGGVTPAAAANIPRAGFRHDTTVPLVGLGEFAGSTGTITFGSLVGLASQPAGRFAFDLAGAALDADVVRPQLRGVAAIRVAGADGTETALDGVVTLRFGLNSRVSSPLPGSIRIDAIQGEGLKAGCECDSTSEAATPPIAAINGIPAGAGAAFDLIGDACLTVDAAGSTIAMADSCSSPCCGCDEQDRLRSAIDDVLEKIRTLEGFVSRVDSAVARFTEVVVASKVSDAGCVECS